MGSLTEIDILVIGGGAAGLLAAGRAAHYLGKNARVVLLEKMEKTGRKIRITGKGRCNITNTKPEEEWLAAMAEHADFFRPAFAHFSPQALIRLLESEGLKLQHERGNRVFPASGKAWDVAETLTRWAQKQGVEILCHAQVKKLLKAAENIVGVECVLDGKPRMLRARQYIVATGGQSYPSTGSSGEGYKWLQQCGLRITPLRPSLVPVAADGLARYGMRRQELKNVEISLLHTPGESAPLSSPGSSPRNKTAGRPTNPDVLQEEVLYKKERGDIILDNGYISGPIVLRMSRSIVDALRQKNQVRLRIDLKPALSPLQLSNRIDRELAEPPLLLGELLRKFVPSALIPLLADRMQTRPDARLNHLPNLKDKLCTVLKNIDFPITGYGSFAEAIVTAGGVDLSQIKPETLRTSDYSNLFIAGELLDLDANTGGYNLQIAFSTGYLAGESAAKNITNS